MNCTPLYVAITAMANVLGKCNVFEKAIQSITRKSELNTKFTVQNSNYQLLARSDVYHGVPNVFRKYEFSRVRKLIGFHNNKIYAQISIQRIITQIYLKT